VTARTGTKSDRYPATPPGGRCVSVSAMLPTPARCLLSSKSEVRSPWSRPLRRPCSTQCSRGRTINRYYDPATDQFLSIDPLVAQTGQAYVFTNDNPLNLADPLGLRGVTNLCAQIRMGCLSVNYTPTVNRVLQGGRTPVVTYETTNQPFAGPSGTTITVSTSLTVAGPKSLSNVDVSLNGSVSVTDGSATANFSPGSTMNDFVPSEYGFTYGYSQTQTVGSGSSADTITANVSVSVTYPSGSSGGPTLEQSGVVVVVGGAITWLVRTFGPCIPRPLACGIG